LHVKNSPLSTEKLSVGRPAIFQALMSTKSPRVSINEKLSDLGIPRFFTDSIQAVICSYNGNMYAFNRTVTIYNKVIIDQ